MGGERNWGQVRKDRPCGEAILRRKSKSSERERSDSLALRLYRLEGTTDHREWCNLLGAK